MDIGACRRIIHIEQKDLVSNVDDLCIFCGDEDVSLSPDIIVSREEGGGGTRCPGLSE